MHQEGLRQTTWKKPESLGLEGEQLVKWNNFVKGLIGLGIDLNSEKYTFLWSWDTKRGQVYAKQAYEVQLLMGGRGEFKFLVYSSLAMADSIKNQTFFLVNA